VTHAEKIDRALAMLSQFFTVSVIARSCDLPISTVRELARGIRCRPPPKQRKVDPVRGPSGYGLGWKM
jgi:hypothetical protein